MAAVSQGSFRQNAAMEGGGIFLNDLKVNDAVVDEEFLSGFKIMDKIRVVHGDRWGRGLGVHAENEGVAHLKAAGLADCSGAYGGALGIEKNGDFLAPLTCQRTQ